MKKYEFTGETKQLVDGLVLHRIRAVVDILNDCGSLLVKSGTVGGWVEHFENLSQEGGAWVSDNACVYGAGYVFGNALVSGDAQVCGDTRVHGNARVSDKAKVYGHADVFGDVRIMDEACVFGHAIVADRARIGGRAQIYDNAEIYDSTYIYGDAVICGDCQIFENRYDRVGYKTEIVGSSTTHKEAERIMRLIDADALIAAYDTAHKWKPSGRSRKLMERAPTGEAIPVEWIEEQIKQYSGSLWSAMCSSVLLGFKESKKIDDLR